MTPASTDEIADRIPDDRPRDGRNDHCGERDPAFVDARVPGGEKSWSLLPDPSTLPTAAAGSLLPSTRAVTGPLRPSPNPNLLGHTRG